MLQTVQETKHHIITAFGPSTSHFGSCQHPPLQGLGQGSGGAPAGWTTVSTPFINMMGSSGFRINLLSAISVSLLSFVCYAFVNNTDVAHCSSLTATTQEIITEIQDVVRRQSTSSQQKLLVSYSLCPHDVVPATIQI